MEASALAAALGRRIDSIRGDLSVMRSYGELEEYFRLVDLGSHESGEEALEQGMLRSLLEPEPVEINHHIIRGHDNRREKAESEASSERRKMVGSGDRSEKIRTYNYPDGRVTDHRPLTRLNISVIVEKDGRRETGTAGTGGRHAMDVLIAPDFEPENYGSFASREAATEAGYQATSAR